MASNLTDQQKIDKSLQTLASIASYVAITKLFSTVYDRQYRKGIRSRW